MRTLPTIYRFNREAEIKLQLVPHQEFAALYAGQGTDQSFHTIAARINLGATCVRWYFQDNAEAKQAMDAAVDAMNAMRQRHDRTGAWGITGDEFRAIGQGLELTDEAQLNLTRKQLDKAFQYIIKVAAE